jgi:hypothetical protein
LWIARWSGNSEQEFQSVSELFVRIPIHDQHAFPDRDNDRKNQLALFGQEFPLQDIRWLIAVYFPALSSHAFKICIKE